MHDLIKNKLDELDALCAKRKVRMLALFGSAVSGDFEPGRSDLDFLVEFHPMTPAQRAENYLGLLVELMALFQTEIDLLEPEPIVNPYFKEAIEKTKTVLYEAAA